ncbi:hypothetical protein EDD17DRAFT_163335 [Pisolithus thermaeus]|nr:hypothetical protein EDD17DRAFT_163335 [Pisolithus thermaeus]
MVAMFSECPDRLSSHSVTASSNSTMVTESDSTLVGHCDSGDDDSQVVVPSWQGSVYTNTSPTCKTLDLDEPRTSHATANSEEALEYFAYEVDAVPPCEGSGVSRAFEAEGVAMTEYDTEEFQYEPTATPFGRQSFTSVVSPFSGVSLLASPQDTCRKTFACGHAQVRTPDLLSPVQLSAKLRPFSLSSAHCPPRRGDSIDSGYAEGDNWIDPEPLSRSPPSKIPPDLVSSSRYSHNLPSTSPLMQECELAYCVSSGRSSPSMGFIEASVPEGIDDCDDGTSSIIEIYESSSSDAEGGSSPTMKISDFTLLREAREGGTSAPLNTVSGLREEPFERPSDNKNTSFGAALSAQPSLDFSDASSRVSLLRHGSPLSSRSGSSTPNTSLFSQDSDSSHVEECLSFPSFANADHPMHSQEFQHVMNEDTTHRPVLAPSQNMVSIEQKSHLPQLSCTGDYEKSDDDVISDAGFLPSFPTPTRREDAEAVQALETGGHKVPLETIASFGAISAEGVLQFPMPPTSEDTASPAFLGDGVTFQQLTLCDAADMQCSPSIRSAQLIYPPPDLAVDTCPTKQRLATPRITSISEELYRSRPDASLPDADRMAAHSPGFGKPSSSTADGVGETTGRQCSSPSLRLIDHQAIDDDLRNNHASSSCTRSPVFIPRDTDISSNRESQHIPLQSPWTPPCSPSPPAAVSPSVPQSVLSRSGSVFRPLLTGRKSLLEMSLFGDRISQNTVARDRSITVSAPSHAGAKEVRGTSVSLNSRRYTQFSANRPTPFSDDAHPLVNASAVQESLSSHPRSHSAPPCRGLRPLRLSSNHIIRKFSSAASSFSIASVQSREFTRCQSSASR